MIQKCNYIRYLFLCGFRTMTIWWHILTTCYEYIVVACWLFYVNETAWELYQCADSKAIINLIARKDKWSFVWGFKVLFVVETQWNFVSFGQISKVSFVLKIQTERSFWWVAKIFQHWRATIYSLFISDQNFVSLINFHIKYNSSYSCNTEVVNDIFVSYKIKI